MIPDHLLEFPISFEVGDLGACPRGFTCVGDDVRVCTTTEGFVHNIACLHPGVSGTDGYQYLVVGNDDTEGTATSDAFILPPRIEKISFKRSGGAGHGSGLYVVSEDSNVALCAAESSRDTNEFFEDSCAGLSAYSGVVVRMVIKDAQKSSWGKVLVDDIRLQDADGQTLSIQRTKTATHATPPGTTGVVPAPNPTITVERPTWVDKVVHVKEDVKSLSIPAGFETPSRSIFSQIHWRMPSWLTIGLLVVSAAGCIAFGFLAGFVFRRRHVQTIASNVGVPCSSFPSLRFRDSWSRIEPVAQPDESSRIGSARGLHRANVLDPADSEIQPLFQ